MNFEIPAQVEHYRSRIAAFVEREILPLETRASSYDGHGNISHGLLDGLRAKARAEGLWCLQLPLPDGSRIGLTGMAVCYEEMNRSIFGPVVFNSAAPDDGNMMVLEKIGTPEQKACG
jgi:acyl-CoA dehydrogenase